jgi:prepilin peptidase CpaA
LSYLPLILQAVLLLIVVPAAIFDFRERRVPNWLALTGVVLGICTNFGVRHLDGLVTSLEGLGLAFLIYFPLYVLRGMGAGDVKLMGAVGAIVGPMNWFWILVLTSAFGAVTAIILVLYKGRLRRTFQNLGMLLISVRHGQAPYESNPELDVRNRQAVRLPHAISIALGAISFLIAGAIWAPK